MLWVALNLLLVIFHILEIESCSKRLLFSRI